MDMDMDEIRPLLTKLNQNTILDILTQAAETHPDVRATISAAITKKCTEESQRVINFEWYSKSVWKEINVNYAGLGGGKQCDRAGEVERETIAIIERIAAQCGPFAHPQTRYNGLSVLRKIGKTICLSSGDVLGHEVQQRFQWDPSLEVGMQGIISAMEPEERKAIREDESSEGALWPKLVELETLAKDHCVFPELAQALDLLGGD
ncbi:hypothetical protein BDW59DRAFT_166763, partial [Aspergillus cavernicola]